MKGLSEFVEEYLPTPWSRRVAISSLTLSTALLFLPEWWQSIGLNPLDQPTLLLRLLLIATTLFLGSFISLVVVTRAYNAQTAEHAVNLQKQKEYYESLQTEEKKRRDDFNKPIDYQNSWMA